MRTLHSKINEHQQLRLPFVVYRKPNTTQLKGFFQSDSTLYKVEDFTEEGFVFASFDGDQKYIIPKSASEILSFPFDKKNITIPLPESSHPTVEEQRQYEELVASGVAAIQNDAFQKVVISREEVVTIPKFDKNIVFERLLQTYPTAFVYCFFHPEIGLWLGATPEQLLKASGTTFQTIALAGTQKASDIEAVIWPNKEKEEQQLVTDYIVSQLQPYTDDLQISEPYTIQAGAICHIRTDIKGSWKKENTLQQIIHLLHPTPAVCGFPAAVAKDFILKNESYNRSFYTGFLGELNSDSSSDLFVNLRCMQVEDQQVHLYMGCGITKDSVPESEWQETVNKSMTMKRVLGKIKQ
jgi:isochorismate synthase